MKKLLITAGLLISLVLPSSVWADQCAYVTKKQADTAAAYLTVGKSFVNFCELCGDTVFPFDDTVSVKDSLVHELPASSTGLNQDYWELLVNGDGVDLAYLYVKQANGTFINLARLARCPTQGVGEAYDANGHKMKLRKLPPVLHRN